MIFDHLSLAVSDIKKSRAFYEHALAPLGIAVRMEFEGSIGIGLEGEPQLWIYEDKVNTQKPMHLAFSSPDRKTVHAFYEEALATGAKDNGAPGLRPEYHPHYYGAFVLDPDGHNIEAVCHRGE